MTETPTTWCSTPAVLEFLDIDRGTLFAFMRDTERAGVEPPWVDIGTRSRQVCHWKFEEVEAWFRKVGKWRRSSREAGNISSVGAIPTESSDPARRPTTRPRSGSSERSNVQSLSDFVGSLPTLSRSSSPPRSSKSKKAE